MKDFFHYFFGKGTEVEFNNFSLAHLLPILLMILAILLIYRYRERLASSKHDTAIRYTLAFALIVSEMSYFWRLVGITELNPNPVDHLPITVCGWAVIFCSYLLIGKSQSLFDIAYFWLFSGTVFALITPTVITNTGPTRFRYYQFWLEHTLGYVTIFYMIFVHRMRPTVRSAFKSYGMLVVLAAVAYLANRVIGPGANYLFMARPEDTPSILDILPPNFALRLTVMTAVVTLMFFLSYLPWYLIDRRAKKQQGEPSKDLLNTET
ncbi:MAG: TIGR02206 family membrane protein [Ruminococcaceae bacterium]|nr:TIGR02206 family membrane protein [Oscillospiraceae bacterium]